MSVSLKYAMSISSSYNSRHHSAEYKDIAILLGKHNETRVQIGYNVLEVLALSVDADCQTLVIARG